MKKKIQLIACVGNYHKLSTFISIEEMNITVRAYRDVIRASIKRSDVQVRLIALLELLKRHSCKYVGVSFMCKNTIAEKLEVSYKTVQRLVKKLEGLEMIKQYQMKRHKDMNQTANAVVILPTKNVDMSDKPPTKKDDKCPTKTNSISLKQNKLNTRNDVPAKDISTANFVAHWVPESFVELVKSYYREAKSIEEFWKVVKQSNRVIDCFTGDRAFAPDQELSIGLMAFKEFVMKVKSGTQIENKFGYFNGIVNKLMDKLFFDTDFMND